MPIKIRIIRNDAKNDIDIYLLWLFSWHIDLDEAIKYLFSDKDEAKSITPKSIFYNIGLIKQSYNIIKTVLNKMTIKKLTIIYNANFKSSEIQAFSTILGWNLIAYSQFFFHNSFKKVSNEYYAINNQTERYAIDLEIVSHFHIIYLLTAIIKNIKELPKIRKYKEKHNGRTSNI